MFRTLKSQSALLKEDRLATIPTLRCLMREAGNHRTRQTCHGEN